MKATVALFLISAGVALATPVEIPEHYVMPAAKAVVDRAETAYAAMHGWTAIVVSQICRPSVTPDAATGILQPGPPQTTVLTTRETYLPGSGPMPFYFASSFDEKGDLENVVLQNADGRFAIAAGTADKVFKLQPSPDSMPAIFEYFRKRVSQAKQVRYAGKEDYGGESCDIVELVDASQVTDAMRKSHPWLPSQFVSVEWFWVNPKGYVVREHNADPFDNGGWTERHLTFCDGSASPAVSDFAYEKLLAAARPLLNGSVSPGIVMNGFEPGSRLPTIKFVRYDGTPLKWDDYAGRVVVVETWASWCHYCKGAFPFYERTRQRLAARGDVIFVALDFDEKAVDYRNWMKEHGDSYGFVFARVDSPDASKALRDFKGSLPGFYVLGRDGRISSTYAGFGYGAGNPDPRLIQALSKAGVTLN